MSTVTINATELLELIEQVTIDDEISDDEALSQIEECNTPKN
jgi:hypothetical protein